MTGPINGKGSAIIFVDPEVFWIITCDCWLARKYEVTYFPIYGMLRTYICRFGFPAAASTIATS